MQSTTTLAVTVGAGAVVGSAVAVAVLPTSVAAAGFTSAGIVAGSSAAAMMSAAAVANGGGVAAWSLVAGLQSVGAVGLATTTAAGMAVVGAAALAGAAAFGVGAYLVATRKSKDENASGSLWDWVCTAAVTSLLRHVKALSNRHLLRAA